MKILFYHSPKESFWTVRIFMVVAFLGTLAVIGCKKTVRMDSFGEGVDAPNIESPIDSDDTLIEEQTFEDAPDEPDETYSSEGEAAIKEITYPSEYTLGGRNWVNIDGCPEYKYAGRLNIQIPNNANAPIHIKLSKVDSFQNISFVAKQGPLDVSNQLRIQPNSFVRDTSKDGYTFTLESLGDTFRYATVKISLQKTGSSVVKSKSIKIVGSNFFGDHFATPIWGLRQERRAFGMPTFAAGSYSSSAVPINTATHDYVPQFKDVIIFKPTGSTLDREDRFGLITTTPTVTNAILKADGTVKTPKKYEFYIAEWNSKTCKYTRTLRKIKLSDTTASFETFYAADKQMKAVKYLR